MIISIFSILCRGPRKILVLWSFTVARILRGLSIRFFNCVTNYPTIEEKQKLRKVRQCFMFHLSAWIQSRSARSFKALKLRWNISHQFYRPGHQQRWCQEHRTGSCWPDLENVRTPPDCFYNRHTVIHIFAKKRKNYNPNDICLTRRWYRPWCHLLARNPGCPAPAVRCRAAQKNFMPLCGFFSQRWRLATRAWKLLWR